MITLILPQKIFLVCDKIKRVKRILQKNSISFSNINFVKYETNDTWVRDFGPLSLINNDVMEYKKLFFNAWGLKFSCNHDNKFTPFFLDKYFEWNKSNYLPIVGEGGAIESNGNGVFMATKRSIICDNRNPILSKKKINKILNTEFGFNEFIWLKNGELEGDDTDSHIDMLARFCDENTICYASTDNEKDPNYKSLKKMEKELKKTRFNLVKLPTPYILHEDDRLPATYTNFLITNEKVIVPVYEDINDQKALEIIKELFPTREIVAFYSRNMIKQGGSVHCATMQIHSF